LPEIGVVSDAGLIKSLRKRFGIRGAADITLQDVIVMTADLSRLEAAPYHSKGGGAFNLGSGPVAAQQSYVGLRAPTSAPKNFRAVIRRIMVASAAAQSIYIKIADSAALDAVLAGPAINVIAGSWDSPTFDEPPIRPQLQSYSTNNVTFFGGDGYLLQVPVGISQQVDFPWVLAPGNTLFIESNVVNTAIYFAALWDEYLIG